MTVYAPQEAPDRLSLGSKATIKGPKDQVDKLELAKVAVQEVTGKTFIGKRKSAQEIVYAVDERQATIYIIGSVSSKKGEGLGKRRTETVSLRFIECEYDETVELLLSQTPDIRNRRQGKRIVFTKSQEELTNTLQALGLDKIAIVSADEVSSDTREQVAALMQA